MKKLDIINYIQGGKNPTYRKIGNNTWAVKAQTIGGDEVYGIQLHRTVIFAWLDDNTIQINDGGWPTVTTRDRINKALRAAEIPASVSSHRKVPQIMLKNAVYGPKYELLQPAGEIEVVDYDGSLVIDKDANILDIPVSYIFNGKMT